MEEILLEGKDLSKYYQKDTRLLGKKQEKFAALNKVSFVLRKGHILGIVGASGSGKSTLARCVADINRLDSGEIFYKGERITQETILKTSYKKKVRLIYQDSFSSFDPKKKMEYSLKEAWLLRDKRKKENFKDFLGNILQEMRIKEELLGRYPGELSGGQCQRMNIARALLLNPEILILDEPVSALDVTLQIQVIRMLERLRQEQNLSYIVISHDMSLIHYLCDDIYTMEKGSLRKEN